MYSILDLILFLGKKRGRRENGIEGKLSFFQQTILAVQGGGAKPDVCNVSNAVAIKTEYLCRVSKF